MSETLGALAALTGGSVLGDASVVISDVTHDHRQCAPGSLFVARRGRRADGHDFVGRAAGCTAACVERPVPDAGVPQLVVSDSAAALGVAAAAVHGYPFQRLRAVGVTGTNGKTMVTRLLGSIAAAAGMTPAVVGTLGWTIGDDTVTQERTSPEASDLQRLAAQMVSAGADLAAFEVSSHALELGRVIGAHFAVAAFTNLSQDHLDFHGDMEEYFASKSRLFSPDLASHGVVWVDDPYGARLAAESTVPITTVGARADVVVSDLAPSLAGTSFTLEAQDHATRIALPLAGAFNVANAGVAAAAALALGVSWDAVVAGLGAARPVSGRFELVDGPWPFSVIVDYAHTPDGIANSVTAARALTGGRVLVVVGAGGDRDRSKRSEMGGAASAADLVVVTSDNPRSEDPTTIAAEVAAGVSTSTFTVLDRRSAIAAAVAEAAAGDIVLILGKGHETVQEFADHSEPFHDASVAREEAAAL